MTRNECEAIRPLISAALDGELDEHEFVQLSEHLASCTNCQQVHRDYQHLREGMRSAPAPAPPPDLARTIRQETVEKPPPSPVIRLASRAGIRFGMSTAAASIVLLIIVAAFAFHTHQQMTHPAIAGSAPLVGSNEPWPRTEPVRIEFTKRMNQESVMANLAIRPHKEQERLPTSWESNTLVIGKSESRSVLLEPQTDYTITIRAAAEDVHGNPIGEDWTISFQTGQEDVAISTPSPTESDDAAQEPTATEETSDGSELTPNDSASRTPPPNANPSATPGDEQTGTGAGAGQTDEEGHDDSPEGEASPEATEEEDSEADSEVEPTPTATQAPEESPTSTPTPKPEPTPSPSPTAPPATATPEPTPSPSPEPIPVRGAFGEVYWGNQSVQDRLGRPMDVEYVELGSELEFQRGVMFRRVNVSGPSIFVFSNDGAVRNYADTWTEADGEFSTEDLSGDLHIPQKHFGKVWADHRGELEDLIGYAMSPEPAANFESRIQSFANGTMIYSRGLVYVIYDDQTWERYQDSNSGGYQHDNSIGGSPDDQGDPPPADDSNDPDEGEVSEPEEETPDEQPVPGDEAGDEETAP